MNYCTNCRRHLNGAVSCPGCGATGRDLSAVQDGRSTLRMPSVVSIDGDGHDAGVKDGARRAQAAADQARRSRAERRGEKRHGIGLMLTGGFAGIIVVAFLLYGNAGGGDGAPAGNVVAAGRTGTATASTAALTLSTISPTGPASSEAPTSASASPTHTASASPSRPSTPEQTTTSAAPSTSATATATRTTASASPTSASPTAEPTPSTTKSSCWLIFCT